METIMQSQKENTSNSQQKRNSPYIALVVDLPPKYAQCGFKNFQVSEQNQTAYDRCSKIKPGESLYMYGSIGSGKTHLAVAVLRNYQAIKLSENEINKSKDDYKYQLEFGESIQKERARKMLESGAYAYRQAICKFLPCTTFLWQLNESSFHYDEGKSKLKMINSLVSNYDCILLDDLGAEKITESVRQNLYVLIDRLYTNMKSIIITSNLNIEELNSIEPRISSRICEMGTIIKFEGDDYRVSKK